MFTHEERQKAEQLDHIEHRVPAAPCQGPAKTSLGVKEKVHARAIDNRPEWRVGVSTAHISKACQQSLVGLSWYCHEPKSLVVLPLGTASDSVVLRPG